MSGSDSSRHVSCQRASELLFDFLEGSLPESERLEVEAHFSRCPPCLEFLQSYRKTPSLCRKALHRDAPTEVLNRVKDFLRKKMGC
jgi:anti-sigma factor RsiW